MKSNITLLFFSIIIATTIIFLFPVKAHSAQLESRINNLESDLNRVELRLNSLESQLNRSPSSRRNKPITTVPTSRRKLSSREKDKMFDRLAIMVIEIKQDLKKLQQRVLELESN
ncbi:MAG: hypothetical protein AAF208_01250 [Cyanobacteria bacterium P01_A01_bin.45]